MTGIANGVGASYRIRIQGIAAGIAVEIGNGKTGDTAVPVQGIGTNLAVSRVNRGMVILTTVVVPPGGAGYLDSIANGRARRKCSQVDVPPIIIAGGTVLAHVDRMPGCAMIGAVNDSAADCRAHWPGFGINPHLAGGCNAAVKRPMIGITYPLDIGSRRTSRHPAADRRESFQLLIRHVKSPPEQPY
jgi:hypothetical protein